MAEPRKSTVFDYSDLRLHPDGTRVHQKSTNLRPKLAQSTVRGVRSNWIATDAGGSLKVPLFRKRKTVSLEEEQEEEEEEIEDGNISPSGSARGEDPSFEVDDNVDENGKRRSRRPDHRKAKRQKFLKSDDYLAGSLPSNLGESSDMNSLSLPHPSPDLLKCIHRFASEFYHEKGQLLNSSRQYRKERKERRMKRDMDRDSSPSSHSTSSSKSGSKSAEKLDEYEDDPDEDEASEGDGVDTTAGTKRRKGRKGRRRSAKLYVDMYKVFDGSAMMALGMLVQEHIAFLLKPSIPESWEREVRSAYTDPWGDSRPLEGKGKDREASQDSPESVAGGIDKERRSPKQTVNMEGNPNHTAPLEVEHDGWVSEEDDESSRSDDTRHSSDSEDEYR